MLLVYHLYMNLICSTGRLWLVEKKLRRTDENISQERLSRLSKSELFCAAKICVGNFCASKRA